MGKEFKVCTSISDGLKSIDTIVDSVSIAHSIVSDRDQVESAFLNFFSSALLASTYNGLTIMPPSV